MTQVSRLALLVVLSAGTMVFGSGCVGQAEDTNDDFFATAEGEEASTARETASLADEEENTAEDTAALTAGDGDDDIDENEADAYNLNWADGWQGGSWNAPFGSANAYGNGGWPFRGGNRWWGPRGGNYGGAGYPYGGNYGGGYPYGGNYGGGYPYGGNYGGGYPYGGNYGGGYPYGGNYGGGYPYGGNYGGGYPYGGYNNYYPGYLGGGRGDGRP